MANTTGKKYGGREKGTPNRTTAEIRDKFQILLSDNLDKLQDDLDKLDPEERLKILLQLSKFVLPTLKSTALDINPNNKLYWLDGLNDKTEEEVESYFNKQYEE